MLSVLLFLLLAVALGPLALPSSFYEERLGPVLQRMTHGNVKAGQINFEYTPAPALIIRNVVLDSDPAVGQIERIVVPVNAYNVFNWGKALRNVTIEGGHFSPTYALSLPQRLKPEADTPRMADLGLVNCSVAVGKRDLGPASGKISFDKAGALAEVMLSDQENRLELHIEPKDAVFALTLNARNWELPFGYPIKFDGLLLKGIANSAGIVIEDIRGDLYSGIVTGNAQVSWGSEGWQLSGVVRTNGLQSEPLSMVFSNSTHISGRMVGEAKFAYHAVDYPQLFDSPAIDATLQFKDGLVHNLDLVSPLKSQGGNYGGGQTRFDTLNTLLQVRPGTVQFNKIAIEGGKFRANGSLAIGKERKLNGGFAAQVSSGSLVVSNQMQVGGELSRPQVRTGAAYRPRGGEASMASPQETAPQ
ncbi:hypothetical protein [Andreprevotia lacus]|uniref:hypothetical protein n=1 Tax=Andreprevotia lacus TaxID=1121000 RepID=UPI0009FF5E3A|nr:hypothetical protein [Andreprevotia lacus]